jgi:DNA polymerase
VNPSARGRAEAESAAPYVPRSRSLRTLASAVQECHGCGLWAEATQAVFGRGPRNAELMLVGEQPGDREDLAGDPFVGPAGRELRAALELAEIPVDEVYLTNAVKHFKWRPRGKRRLHVTPRAGEIEACKPWLEAELEAVRPRAVLAMGAVAARALFGTKVKVMKDRRRLLDSDLAPVAAVTIHPSAILRQSSSAERKAARREFVEDLRFVAREAEKAG